MKTWTNENIILYLNISDYIIVSKERVLRGSGVALYIQDCINYTVRDDIGAYSGADFECAFVELPVVHQRKKIVCIYRAQGLNMHLLNNKFD